MKELEFPKVYGVGMTKPGGVTCFFTEYDKEYVECHFYISDLLGVFLYKYEHDKFTMRRAVHLSSLLLANSEIVHKSKIGIIIKFPDLNFDEVFPSERFQYDETLFSNPVKKQAR